jgi:hypothetical protein
MTEVSAEEPALAYRVWHVEATEAGLLFRCPDPLEPVEERIEPTRLPQTVQLNDSIILNRSVFAFVAGKRRLLTMSDEAIDELLRGLGREIATTWIVRTRARYFAILGVFFLFTAVPMPGDAETGLEAVPTDYLGGVLGLGLIGLAAWARFAPRAAVLFADAVWLGILAMDVVNDVISGQAHPAWLLVAIILLPLPLSALKNYNRLRRVFP